jgi:hypothetical protein
VLLGTIVAPDTIAAASAPIGVPDARQIEAGTIKRIHAPLMIADIVDDIEDAVRER